MFNISSLVKYPEQNVHENPIFCMTDIFKRTTSEICFYHYYVYVIFRLSVSPFVLRSNPMLIK
jgi:hypothetical protein